jgi:hypothetical protein
VPPLGVGHESPAREPGRLFLPDRQSIAATVALLRVLVLVDLREQHWAQATGSKPHYALSPLFLVVGQCLMASALTCALLFARVDVFFFVLVNLSLSLLLMSQRP